MRERAFCWVDFNEPAIINQIFSSFSFAWRLWRDVTMCAVWKTYVHVQMCHYRVFQIISDDFDESPLLSHAHQRLHPTSGFRRSSECVYCKFPNMADAWTGDFRKMQILRKNSRKTQNPVYFREAWLISFEILLQSALIANASFKSLQRTVHNAR